MLQRLAIGPGEPPRGDGPTTRRIPALHPLDRRAIADEFPTVDIDSLDVPDGDSCFGLTAEAWQSPTLDLRAADARAAALAAQGPFAVRVTAPPADVARVSVEVLTRLQLFIGRRNRFSRGEAFDRALLRHRGLHDLDKPLVRADHEHALDTWQWMLRLDPSASLAAQVAALFHDVERLASEPEARREQRAPDYQAFKDAHARRGAEIARRELTAAGLDRATIDRAAHLISMHERLESDPDLALLSEADALSFFSRNSDGFADYFGPEHTRRKVAYSLGRLRPATRRRLRSIRLRADVAAAVRAELEAAR